MANSLLSTKVAGSIIKIKESGSPVEFIVCKHDYESELNGSGRTLVVRKDCYDNRQWHSSNVNAYATSDIDAWFNSTYKTYLMQTSVGPSAPRNSSTPPATATTSLAHWNVLFLVVCH